MATYDIYRTAPAWGAWWGPCWVRQSIQGDVNGVALPGHQLLGVGFTLAHVRLGGTAVNDVNDFRGDILEVDLFDRMLEVEARQRVMAPPDDAAWMPSAQDRPAPGQAPPLPLSWAGDAPAPILWTETTAIGLFARRALERGGMSKPTE